MTRLCLEREKGRGGENGGENSGLIIIQDGSGEEKKTVTECERRKKHIL